MDAQKKEKNHVEGFQRLRENSEAYPLDTSPQWKSERSNSSFCIWKPPMVKQKKNQPESP